MYPLMGLMAKQNLESILEVIQRKRLDSLDDISALSRKLKTMQNQPTETFQAEILGFDEKDYDSLNQFILVTCEVSTLLAVMVMMNEIGWPT